MAKIEVSDEQLQKLRLLHPEIGGVSDSALVALAIAGHTFNKERQRRQAQLPVITIKK